MPRQPAAAEVAGIRRIAMVQDQASLRVVQVPVDYDCHSGRIGNSCGKVAELYNKLTTKDASRTIRIGHLLSKKGHDDDQNRTSLHYAG